MADESGPAGDARGGAPGSGHRRLLPWAMLALVVCQLAFLYTEAAAAGLAAAGLVTLLPVIAWRSLRLREGYLLAFCAVLVVIAGLDQRPVADLAAEGLSRASFLASFILLMGLLREGAVTSPSVEAVGLYLTHQPPSRRFLSIFAGSHVFAVLINLGALSLLAPIVQRGVRATVPAGQPLDDIARVRERRQLSAVLRGFSWFLVWAPTAVTQAVMPTLMAGIDALRLMLLGLCLAAVMMAVSWLEDRLRWLPFRRQLQAEGRLPVVHDAAFPADGMRSLAFVCLGLFGLPLLLMALFAVTIVEGVMLAAPLIVAVWVLVQHDAHRRRDALAAAARRLDAIAFEAVPGLVRLAVFLACAGFIGTLAAKLVPVADLAAAVDLDTRPGWLVLWVLTASVWVFGQVGLSPITMAVFLGSLVAELPSMPVDMTHAALAIATGTAISTAGAPFSTGAALLARVTGHSPFTLTWRWNGPYIALALVVLAGVYALLSAL